MKKLYSTGFLLLCCAAYSQTEHPSQNETAANKYAGIKVQQSDALQLIYTTDKKLLKTKSETPQPSDAVQIVPTPESAKKKTGPILQGVSIATK